MLWVFLVQEYLQYSEDRYLEIEKKSKYLNQINKTDDRRFHNREDI